MTEVPIFALEAAQWKESLIGALIPRAILVSLLVIALAYVPSYMAVLKTAQRTAVP